MLDAYASSPPLLRSSLIFSQFYKRILRFRLQAVSNNGCVVIERIDDSESNYRCEKWQVIKLSSGCRTSSVPVLRVRTSSRSNERVFDWSNAPCRNFQILLPPSVQMLLPDRSSTIFATLLCQFALLICLLFVAASTLWTDLPNCWIARQVRRNSWSFVFPLTVSKCGAISSAWNICHCTCSWEKHLKQFFF